MIVMEIKLCITIWTRGHCKKIDKKLKLYNCNYVSKTFYHYLYYRAIPVFLNFNFSSNRFYFVMNFQFRVNFI